MLTVRIILLLKNKIDRGEGKTGNHLPSMLVRSEPANGSAPKK